ncbi:uncharacterized protein [Dysidea avara]|uniref:uncharacterized protein n=1 Tax=Dysidea avara TaxID=196820 RepID=UPI00332B9D7A
MLSVIFIITVILTKELVMATEQCSKYQFKSPFYPGESCEDIYNKNPESHEWSGYYWITNGPSRVYCGMTYTGSSCEDIYNNNPETGDMSGYYRININQWTFCNMTAISGFIPTCAGVGGGWRRIANINVSTRGDCPSGWRNGTHSDVSFCRVVSDGTNTCSSTNFPTYGRSYQRVCGRARGYQKGWSNAFYTSFLGFSIDRNYVDGLSITHGNPRQHIWTFASGLHDSSSNQFNCPCAPGSAYSPPPFVGTDYYCESGTNNTYSHSTYYFNDPLWDGSGCITSNCCDNPTQPWFYREMDGTTTDDIEARICGHNDFSFGFVIIDQLELYIQ